MEKQFEEMDVLSPAGFISGYMHNADLEFVQNGDEPNQGYFRLPKDEIIQEMHVKNLIVDRASVFMANRMRPGSSWGTGIQYLELGTGVGSGTTQNPESENVSQTRLRQAIARKEITSWTYLDANNNPTGSETNVIQLTTTFNETEAVGAIVEMGLFGGAGGSTSLNTGYMFNYKTFPVWNKQEGMKLTIVWKLTF